MNLSDVDILHELSDQGIAFFTPSTENCRGSRVTCYDDRFILKCASEDKAVVLSNDKYKDLINEDAGFRETIRHRLLTYMFAGDKYVVSFNLCCPVSPPFTIVYYLDLDSHVCDMWHRSGCFFTYHSFFYYKLTLLVSNLDS